MVMNGHEYCVCSAAMWPQGGELGPLQPPFMVSNNSPQDLWKRQNSDRIEQNPFSALDRTETDEIRCSMSHS